MDKMKDNHVFLKYEGLRVPRYTSYPTAPHFNSSVNATTYSAWLGELSQDSPLSLYIHVPFCSNLCWFCGCSTKVARKYDPVAAYVDVLIKEIDMVAAHWPERRNLRHIHWGGGTPNILSAADFIKIMQHIKERFQIADDAEIAIEIDPRTIDDDKIAALSKAGINRVSIGVQTFDEEVQKAVNRVQPFAMITANVVALRRHGIKDINFDILYGLPRQTTANVVQTVEAALTISPNRFSVFGYAHLPNLKAHQKLIEEQFLPNAAERMEQFFAISATLQAAGYIAIGLDHFARADDPLAQAANTGKLHRNFQGYTDDECETLIGIGPSAIGKFKGGYVQNATGIDEHSAAIKSGIFATVRGRSLTIEDNLRREVIERLMCDMRVDLSQVAQKHGYEASFFASEIAKLAPFAADGIVKIDGYRIELAPQYRLLVRNIAAVFDTYFRAEENRHALAI